MQTRNLVLSLLVVVAGGCVVTTNCPVGQVSCGGYCADLSRDDLDCGACGYACRVGDFCSGGECVISCYSDASPCSHDLDCCSNYCASDGRCGCIPTNHAGCAGASDCCSGHCARDGVCDP
jgi:hypothetical protein